ncbi:unnamed protein product [Heterobilharzia americana]|nr:unnamed protein product [Heterobilharzia americana]
MIVSDKICHSSVQEMTYGDEEAFRVQLVATVLRNLAVDDALSAVIIGRHPQALRFTFLCIYAKHSCLHQLGLEILSSLHFPVLGSLIPALHRLLTTLLVCPDRIDRIHGLQIVKNLCTTPLFDVTYDCVPSIGTKRVSLTRTDRNIAFLTSLPPATFSSIASTLCLRDLHLVVLAVDTIHNLTSLGPALCDRLLQLGSTFSNISTSLEFHLAHQNISLLPLLVALLNLEAQAMGSDSLIRVRVMQALGAEPITKSSVSKPVASIVSLLAKTTSTAVLTTSNPFTQPQDPTVVSTTTPIVQLPIHCSQSNLTLPLNHPSHCTSYHPSIHDSSSQISTEKTSISVSHNYLPTNVSSCCSFSISSNAPVINSSANGIQVTDSCRVNKRDLLIRNCLPIIPTPRVSFSRHETDSVIHTTQQNSGSSSTIKSTLPVMQAHSVLSTTNSVVSNNGVPSVNGLKSKVCLSQQIPTALISNTSASTFNPEVQKQINTSSKYLATENGLPQLDRREFMFQWLKSNYAVHNHSSIPRIQIYNEYQKAHLQRFRNIGAVSPVDFHSQIKTIFPGVGQVKVQVPGGSVEIHYNNLKHVDAPEPESQQGINDIMASVLSPKVETINPESRSLKIKCRKRTITGTFPHLSSAKLASKNEDISNHVLKNTRVDVRELNGHTESSKLTNGQIIHPLNGLSRDTSDVISANSSVPNGPPLKKRNVCISASEDSCIQKASTTMVSLSDSKIVIVPVFTTYAIGHGLTLKGTITNDLPVLPNIQTTEHREVTTAKETFASTYSQTTTVSRTEVNLVKSIVTPHVVSCISSSFSSQSKKHIDSTAVPGNNSYNATTISGENLRLHCQWSMCRQSFLKSDELWNHFQNIHYESLRNMCQIKCAWGNCSEMIYNSSLDLILNHLTSKHCFQLPSKYKSVPSSNTDPNLATANTNQADCDTTEGTTLNFSPCEIEKPLIYDDLLLSNTLSEECHRALTGGISNPPFAPMPVHEGPVTKHLRLTAALALRNLLQYSDVARRYMSSWRIFYAI